MQPITSTELTRDCEAIQIPAGTPGFLPKGTGVDITQRLGGSFTVRVQGGLFRIAAKDADALGLDASQASAASDAAPEQPLNEQQVWGVLRACFDPEIPVNIVDLGLVYDMHIEPLPENRSKVFVKMTLTAPGCGMGSVIAGDAQQRLLELPGIADASVEIVWDPPWHQSMITVEGRKVLGLE